LIWRIRLLPRRNGQRENKTEIMIECVWELLFFRTVPAIWYALLLNADFRCEKLSTRCLFSKFFLKKTIFLT